MIKLKSTAISKSGILVCILTLCSVFCCAPHAQAQRKAAEGIRPSGYTANAAPLTSHWSLYLDAGGNWFDADYGVKFVHALYAPSVGAGVTYYFNPTWGLGLGYTYSNHRITNKEHLYTHFSEDTDLFRAQMHRVQLFSTFDVVNAWLPGNTNKIVALNILAGGGTGFYNRSQYMDLDGLLQEDNKYHICPMIMAGADLQFNVSRSISLGLKVTYTYFSKDDLEGRIKGTNNDGIVDLGLSLRYKINAVKTSHVCNVTNEDKFIERNEKAKQKDAPAKVDTLVLMQKDTVVITNTVTEVQEVAADNNYYIYFAPNQSTLKDPDLAVIQQVASRLQRTPDTYIEIVGYCDNTGSEKYNLQLGHARAYNVMNEFLEEYGIAPERMVAYSGGIISGKRSKAAYGPNRRVEIRLLNAEQFEAAKQQYRQTLQQNPAPESAAPITERISRQLPAGSTLMLLAREEYGNANCWVYIYEANRRVIADPDHVQAGQTLIIPALTDEQKTISESRAAALYTRLSRQVDTPVAVDMQLSDNIVATEVTRADWTLAKMARKHYGNTHCWVYIYMANQTKIANPDKVAVGIEIGIPELTEEQQSITRQQANQILANLK